MTRDPPSPERRQAPAAPVADEAEPLPLPSPRRGRSPRRWLVELELDEADEAAFASELARLLEQRAVPGSVVPIDGRRELPWTDLRFLALDTETTGLDPSTGRVIEVAWVLLDRGKEVARHTALCQPGEALLDIVKQITGIDDAMLEGGRPFAEIAPSLVAALGRVDFVTAYNAAFDRAFLERELTRAGLSLPDVPWVDPLVFVREVDRFKPGKKLEEVSRRWGVALDRPHRALDDAVATGELLLRVSPFLPARTLEDLLDQQHRLLVRQRLDERAWVDSHPPEATRAELPRAEPPRAEPPPEPPVSEPPDDPQPPS